MGKALRNVAVMGLSVTAAVILFPGAALAAGNSNTCYNSNICGVSTTGFPGGTISVDADVTGNGTGSWTLYGPNGYRCNRSFPASDPLRSWTCTGAPSGSYNATVSPGEPVQTLKIGIRW